MNFALGNVNVAVLGNSIIAESLRDVLDFIQTDSPNIDLVFEFVDELPDWYGRPYVSLDNYRISDDRFRIEEKLFCYELRISENPIRALVSVKRASVFRKAQRAIRKSWRYFHTHGDRAYLHYLKRFIFYIYMPLVELVLLKKGSSLAHCSAIEKANQVVLFPAWGGVGKTGIMSRYIEDGWKFLSDDSSIISNDGTAYIHPLPLHIYKYHETQSSELVGKMLSQATTFDKLLWRVMSFMKRPDKLVRWVNADKVFGKDKISLRGNISAVIHMHRHIKCDTFKLRKVESSEVAKLMASTILDEVNNLANTSIVIHSCQPVDFIPDITNLHRSIVDIYSAAFSRANCYTLSIPERAMAEDIYSFIWENKLF